MKRREFITLVGGTVATWPLEVRAQQPMPVIGFLSGLNPEMLRLELTGFDRGLSEIGFIDGQNVTKEFHWADHYDQLPTLAADLVARRVAVIVATGNVAARTAKATTDTIPIVFHTGDDPIAVGLVSSLSHPGGNVTGVSAMAGVLPAKRLELMHQLQPNASTIGFLVNPNNANAKNDIANLQAAAQSIGTQIDVLMARSISDFENVFAAMVQSRVNTLLVNSDAFLTGQRDKLVALAGQYKIPTMYSYREFAMAGGLISYGATRADTYRAAGMYVGRILKGEKAGDLPVQQAAKFELVINIKTAATLGLTVPPSLLALADEVIE